MLQKHIKSVTTNTYNYITKKGIILVIELSIPLLPSWFSLLRPLRREVWHHSEIKRKNEEVKINKIIR